MAKPTVKVKLRLDLNKILLVGHRAGDQACAAAARNVSARAKQFAPHDTGALARSIKARKQSQAGGITRWQVGAYSPYAIFQELGTGPIYPVRAKVLRFKPKGSAAFVFTNRTRGVPATHFMRRAIEATTVRDFTT